MRISELFERITTIAGGDPPGRVRYEADAQTEWNARTSRLQATTATPVLVPHFSPYLVHGAHQSCLEVGALPGNHLAYVQKAFGFNITGIDFSDNEEIFHRTMAVNGIDKYEFIKGDFFQHEFESTFDVVMSFGFIEHFDDLNEVIARHCRLVSPGGLLILSVPNFRYVQFAYHFLFDRPNLRIHNLDAMRPNLLDSHLVRAGFTRLLTTYVGRLSLWREQRYIHPVTRILDAVIRRTAAGLGRVLPTSRFYSPYLLLIYRNENASRTTA